MVTKHILYIAKLLLIFITISQIGGPVSFRDTAGGGLDHYCHVVLIS